jgi:hypothetical protein
VGSKDYNAWPARNDDNDSASETARLQELTTAINQRLIVSSIHEQELREVAER